MIGQTISHYKILEKLGEGGMGVVYKAEDTKLDRFVAIKILPSKLGDNEQQKNRFLQEAKAASAIDHANIGAIYEIGENDGGELFIVMAYYEGKTLKQKITDASLSVEASLDIVIQAAKGLANAHSRSIVHRDIKPANILLTNDGIVKIIDFGLAKLAGQAQLTMIGTTVGTAAYMSPEQARGDEIDHRTDIWSLGVVLYQMLTARLPFAAEYEPAIVYSILNEAPKHLSELRPELPQRLEEIVNKALAKSPADRYQSMNDFIAALKGYAEKGTGETSAQKWRAQFSAKKKIVLFTILGVVVIGGLSLLITSLFKKEQPLTSVAVMPFTIANGDQSLEYLSVGLTEKMISMLSSSRDLRVSSFTSTNLLKKQNPPSLEIAGILHVQALVFGTIELNGDNLRIGSNAIDASDGHERWSMNLHKKKSEIFAMQEEIVHKVFDDGGIKLTEEQNNRIARRPTSKVEAYELYLKGIFNQDKLKKIENRVAIEYFEQAVARDPTFAEGYAALASAQYFNVAQGFDDNDQWLQDARMNCLKALDLDSTLAGAYSTLGSILGLQRKRDEALWMLERSIVLNPNLVASYSTLGTIYIEPPQNIPKALTYFMRAMEIEPTNYATVMNVGIARAMMKDYRGAVAPLRLSTTLTESSAQPWQNLGIAYERLGIYDSAVIAYSHAVMINPGNPGPYENTASIFLVQGTYVKAESVLTIALRSVDPKYNTLYLLGVSSVLRQDNPHARSHFQEGLKIVETLLAHQPDSPELSSCAGLFHARLGHDREALSAGAHAADLDSTNAEAHLSLARINAILKRKSEMLLWLERARKLDADYDAANLATQIDFRPYRNDADFLFTLSK